MRYESCQSIMTVYYKAVKKGAELLLHLLTQTPVNQIKTWPKAGIIQGTVNQVQLNVLRNNCVLHI